MFAKHKRPGPAARIAALLLVLPATLLQAGPSTRIGDEWFVPLELGTGGFALIEAASGQLRLGAVDAANNTTFSSVQRSYLSGITGATTGFNTGGVEQLLLSSRNDNRMTFVRTDAGPLTQFYPQEPGPVAPALVRVNAASLDHVVYNSAYASGGEVIELNRQPNVGGGTHIDTLGPFEVFRSMQPLYLSASGRRQTACTWDFGGATRFLTLFDGGGFVNGLSSSTLPSASVLASNVIGDSGSLMVVGFVPGDTALTLVTMNTGPTPWVAIAPFPVTNAPFPVGAVSAVDAGAAAPKGILITSADGSQALHARINFPGNALILGQTFTASPGLSIHGLLPVPGRGVLVLEGTGMGPASEFRFYAWNGANWTLRDSGSLPSLLPPQLDFATIFWFSGEPLVDLSATLLQLDNQPDWTNGTGPLPSALTQETFVDSTTGLANPLPVGIGTPVGANWVMTNQYLDTVSVTTLASNAALITPSLQVTPASGAYLNPVEITATFDSSINEVFYRNADTPAAWSPYTLPFTIGYSSTWQFYARDKLTGALGPILERSYTFSLADLASFDSDGDGVPDFVEQFKGLNANKGADSDGDGRSDLEELLDGTDPDDDTDFTAAGARNPPYNGEGFLLIAEATDTSTGKASPGERIDIRSMASAFLATASVEQLTSPPVLAGQLGAPLDISTPLSGREWTVVNSPRYFDLGTISPAPRDGREVYRLVQVPDIAPPVIAPALTGTDLPTDAALWITAAQAAYAAYYPVTTITDLSPRDTAIAVLGEAALYNALTTLDPALQTTLGVPATPQEYTLFGDRDTSRLPLSPAMTNALLADGLSFANLLALLESEVAASPNLLTLIDALYAWHIAHSLSAPVDPVPPSYMPGLPFPLDVLRLLARDGDLPYEVDSDPPGLPHWDYRPAATNATVTGAKAEMAAILAQLPSAYRPTAVWSVEVGLPTINGQSYGYTNTATLNKVALLDEDGGFLNLDQGLGLPLGTILSVTGYTDVTGPPAHDPIEVLALTVLSIPIPTNTDTNANLLDDDWELFFFGALGVVGPHDPHPVTGYSYLQYMLSGTDPRSDDIPDGGLLNLDPPTVTIVQLPSTNYALQFPFPDLYFNSFDWGVQDADESLAFNPLATAAPVQISPNLYQIDLGAPASSFAIHFFRLTMALQE